ncbi:MAG: dirigent protein, partial [Pseudomonadales bacterium]|nr:dirigent protein [Pseudomonadales bacterium]
MNTLSKAALSIFTACIFSQPSLALETGYDLSGYRIIDSNADAADKPSYAYQDISTTGDALLLNKELVTIEPIFPFDFYGEIYDEVVVSVYGIVGFWDNMFLLADYDLVNNAKTAIPISPDQQNYIPAPFLAPFYDDLDLSNYDIYAQLQGDPGNQQYIVQYQSAHAHDPLSPAQRFEFQVILNESDNSVLFQYKHSDNNSIGRLGSEATIGIQNNQSEGLSYASRESALEDQLAVLFSKAEQYIGSDKANGSKQTGRPGERVKHTVSFINATGATAVFNLTTTESIWSVELSENQLSMDDGDIATVDVWVEINDAEQLQSLSDQFLLQISGAGYQTAVNLQTDTTFIERLTHFEANQDKRLIEGILGSNNQTAIVNVSFDEKYAPPSFFTIAEANTQNNMPLASYFNYADANFGYSELINNIFFISKSAGLYSDTSEPSYAGLNAIYRMDIHGQEPQKLVELVQEQDQYSDENSFMQFAAARNAYVLAFLSNDDWTGENPDKRVQLFLSDLDGKQLEQITQAQGVESSDTENQIAISDDGSTVVFSHNANLLNEPELANNNNYFLYRLDTASSELIRLSADELDTEYLDISADGEKIVWVADADDEIDHIYTINRDGSNFKQITYDQQNNDYDDISLSGDGRIIVVEANSDLLGIDKDNALDDLFLLGYDGANVTRITHSSDFGDGSFEALNPEISPDGEWLLFKSNAPITDTTALGEEQIYLLNLQQALPEFFIQLNQTPEPEPETTPEPEPQPAPSSESAVEISLEQKPNLLSENRQCSPEPYCDTAGSMTYSGLLLMLMLGLVRFKATLGSSYPALKHIRLTPSSLPQAILLGSLIASASLAQADNHYARWLTIADAKRSPAEHIDLGKPGDSLGEHYVFDQALLNKDGRDIGNNSGYCVRTKLQHSLQCQWTLTLAEGTIQVAGREFDQGESIIPIVGGSGKFQGIDGYMRSFKNPDGN